MKWDFVSKFFGQDKVKLDKLIQDCERGSIECEHCKLSLNFTKCVPLSLMKCPKCGDLVFIPLKIQDWWLLEPIGAGGFGSVYLARLVQDHEFKAAVKVLQKTDNINEDIIAQFIREGEIAYSLRKHPHLMETYAIGDLDDNTPYIIMEFVEGERFANMISIRGKIPPEECLYYGLDMLSALEYINECGFVYRDMKPENMIIGSNGLAKLIDFGLSMDFEEAQNPPPTGPVVGSALFMPPERCFRQGEDFRSDIYSLGMVIYFSLMGDSFFTRTEIRTAVRAHTMKLRIQTQSRMAGCDPTLIDLVDHMIRREVDVRFQSFEEIRMAFFSILAGYQEQRTRDPFILARRQHFLNTYGELKYED